MTKNRNTKYSEVPTEEINNLIVSLKITSDTKGSFENFKLDKITGMNAKQMRRVCNTNYKYITVSRVGNLFTYFVSVSVKSFTWYASFSEIKDAVISIKRKFAEHNLPVKSIKRY